MPKPRRSVELKSSRGIVGLRRARPGEQAKRSKITGREFSSAEVESRERRKANTRACILAAAKEIFLEQGYSASLDVIAQRAGVARTSVFNLFKSKTQLFELVVDETFEKLFHSIEHVPENLPLRETLLIYGRSWVSMAISREAIALTRQSVSEVGRELGLGRLSYESGKAKSVNLLARNLKKRMARGEIISSDPISAAERFLAAAVGQARNRRLLGVDEDDSEKLDRFVVETVEIFVKGMSI